ncbi:unnamed protein product, partial [marine sediment metagenome]
MSDKTTKEREKEHFERWQAVKRRAYTYQEKKVNNSTDFEFYRAKFGREVSMEQLHELLEAGGHKVPSYKMKELRKMALLKFDREAYEEDEKTGEGLFQFMLGLREDLPMGFTNSEVYVLGIHYILRLNDAKEEDPSVVFTEEAQAEIVWGILRDMCQNWKYYLDTATQATGKLIRL